MCIVWVWEVEGGRSCCVQTGHVSNIITQHYGMFCVPAHNTSRGSRSVPPGVGLHIVGELSWEVQAEGAQKPRRMGSARFGPSTCMLGCVFTTSRRVTYGFLHALHDQYICFRSVCAEPVESGLAAVTCSRQCSGLLAAHVRQDTVHLTAQHSTACGLNLQPCNVLGCWMYIISSTCVHLTPQHSRVHRA